MSKKAGRKRHSNQFKAKVALEALKGLKTMAEIASEEGIHPSQVATWKSQLAGLIEEGFSKPARKAGRGEEKLREGLYAQIGRLQMENDWLKKKL